MDVTTYTWINIFGPNSQPSPSNSSDSRLQKIVIILASLLGALGLANILVCGFFIYRRRIRKSESPGIPGTTEDNHPGVTPNN